eukprot:Seg257.5 transcript_id=Seg257.5/GoldUCD/mRNA.D3Y31 product="Glycosylated lysosomal membrane protein A" protein_id=Seg257.5/GoldUCD/D3Y31
MEAAREAFLLLLALFAISKTNATTKPKRDVKIHEYSCPQTQCGKDYVILHVKAKSLSSNDTIHYLWSTIGLPTIVVAHTTDITAHPVINWNNGPNFEIQFVPPVPSMSAFVISNVTEYRDSKDNQDVTANAQIRDVLPKFSWSFKHCRNLTGDGADALFTGTWNTSTMEFALKTFSADDYDSDWPHEHVNENSTRFTITLSNLPTTDKKSRYAVHVGFVKKSGLGAPSFETSRSIDDEHTPGIFKLWKLKVPVGKDEQSFASWKPVAYRKAKREHVSQTFAYNFPKKVKGNLELGYVGRSLINSILRNDKLETYTVTESFGQKDDGFYKGTKDTGIRYISWTGMVGYGVAPEQKISLKVYLILSIGLGLPVAISVFGSLILIVKKSMSGKKAAYEQIN